MSFDPVAYALGLAGASRNVVSALIGAAGGGGEASGTLEESGWVKEIGAKSSVSGNVIDLGAGSVQHTVKLAPPESIRAGRTFESGDVLVIAVKITSVSGALEFKPNSNTVGVLASATGLFSVNGTSARGSAAGLGSDVLTLTFSAQAMEVRFTPLNASGYSVAEAYATCEITGLSFNGTTIFGKV